MYMTLMFLCWLFFVNSETTFWSVSSMRSSKMIKCLFLGSRVSKSGNLCWKSTPSTVPYTVWYSPQDAIWYWGHHMSDIVNESPDKDRFSTSGWSRDHTGKRMNPWHEIIGIVSVWNPQQKRIIGFQNIIGFFFFITLWVWLLLLLLWGKRVWMLLLFWDIWLLLLLLLWGIWLLLLKCRLLLTVFAF